MLRNFHHSKKAMRRLQPLQWSRNLRQLSNPRQLRQEMPLRRSPECNPGRLQKSSHGNKENTAQAFRVLTRDCGWSDSARDRRNRVSCLFAELRKQLFAFWRNTARGTAKAGATSSLSQITSVGGSSRIRSGTGRDFCRAIQRFGYYKTLQQAQAEDNDPGSAYSRSGTIDDQLHAGRRDYPG